jgi:hypothetical protein
MSDLNITTGLTDFLVKLDERITKLDKCIAKIDERVVALEVLINSKLDGIERKLDNLTNKTELTERCVRESHAFNISQIRKNDAHDRKVLLGKMEIMYKHKPTLELLGKINDLKKIIDTEESKVQ